MIISLINDTPKPNWLRSILSEQAMSPEHGLSGFHLLQKQFTVQCCSHTQMNIPLLCLYEQFAHL